MSRTVRGYMVGLVTRSHPEGGWAQKWGLQFGHKRLDGKRPWMILLGRTYVRIEPAAYSRTARPIRLPVRDDLDYARGVEAGRQAVINEAKRGHISVWGYTPDELAAAIDYATLHGWTQ